MNDRAKSNDQLLAELHALRAEVALLTYDHNRDNECRCWTVQELREVLAIVNSRRSVDDILQRLIQLATRRLGADAGAIYWLQEYERHLEVRAAHGLAADAQLVRVPVGWGTIGLTVLHRRPMTASLEIVGPPSITSPSTELEPPAGWAALAQWYTVLLAVPLIIRDEVYGATVFYQRTARTFTAEDIQQALAFGDHAALAIENARLFAVAYDTAALEARQRLARELHDSATQTLYVVKLYTEAAARRVAAGDAATATTYLREVRGAAQEALQEMRLLIFELLPPILQEQGLASAIQARLEAVEGRAGLQTSFKVEGEYRRAAVVEHALYRVAQEALNNALRHAQAHNISVILRQTSHGTELTVTDDGIGFDLGAGAVTGGLGLSGMRERVDQLGGHLVIESSRGNGTVVRVEVPS